MKKDLHIIRRERKNSFNQGHLVPIGVMEALPGDVLRHKVESMMRTQPLNYPVMHKLEAKIHHWFVPYRLIWSDFEKFITGGPDGLDTTTPPYLTIPGGGFAVGSLADHLGVTPSVAAGTTISALPFRAYALIWNEFYRDQDLQTKVTVSLGNGSDTTTNVNLLRACWDKDYFTSARPDTQKGDEVTIPLGGTAPVMMRTLTGTDATGRYTTLRRTGGGAYETGSVPTFGNSASEVNISNSSIHNLEADMTDAVAPSVNQLRLAIRLQTYKENMLRGGARMVERLEQAFGVRMQDTRIPLPDYLGGGAQIFQFSEVLQTSEGTEPVGQLYGHGVTAMGSNAYKKFIPEYGLILSFIVVRPKTAYMNGNHRMWYRTTKEDFFQPELQHIGMQGIYNKELYAAHSAPDAVFGYQDRYDEYRYYFDDVAGEPRSTLDYIHMARKFSTDPALNSTFVECSGVDRPFSTAVDQFQGRFIHRYNMRRVLHSSGKPTTF